MIAIEHDGWTLTVEPGLGGSTRSLSWNGRDVLRPGRPGASDPLEMASFPLAPFSNRIGCGGFDFEGQFYSLPTNMAGVPFPIHGFAWQRPWSVSGPRTDGVRMIFEDRQSPWPQPYNVSQDIAISGNIVRFSIALTNVGEGAMPAGIGLHPYFLRGNNICEIDPGRMWVQDEDGLPVISSPDHVLAAGRHPMRDVRLDHSFSGWNGVAIITDPDQRLETRLTASDSLRELVIYSPDADYFCLEPVSHVTNAVHGDNTAKSAGWRILAPGETLSGWFELSVKEMP